MAQAPEIKVRLTAEGQQDVIAALRKVSTAAVKAQTQTSKAFAFIGKQLGALRTLLPTLGLAAAITGFTALARTALTTADNIGKAATRVGTTAETLSVLDFAAATAETTLQDVEAGMVRLARTLGDLEFGLTTAVRGFDILGLSAEDFQGLDTGEAFVKVSEALGKMEVGLKRTEAATLLLGTGGAKLATLMNDLANEGFVNVAARAAAAGQLITTEMAASAAAAQDAFTLIGRQVRGTAIAFTAGFGPALTEVLTNFREDVEGGGTGMEDFGRIVGEVLRNVIGLFQLFGGAIVDLVVTPFRQLGRTIGAAAAAIAAVLRGDFAGAATVIGDRFRDGQAEVADFVNRASERMAEFRKRVERPIKIPIVVSQEARGAAQASTARAEVIKQVQRLENLIGDAQVAELQKVAAQRRTILQQSADAEQEILEARAKSFGASSADRSAARAAQTAAINQRLALVKQGFDTEVELARTKERQLITLARAEVANKAQREAVITQISRQSSQAQLNSATTLVTQLIAVQKVFVSQFQKSQAEIVALDKETADQRLELADIDRAAQFEGLSDSQKISQLRQEAAQEEALLRANALAGDVDGARKLREELQKTATELTRLGADTTGRQAFADANRLFELAASSRRLSAQAASQEAEKGVDAVQQQLQAAKAQIDEFSKALTLQVEITPSQQSLNVMVTAIREELERQPFNINVTPTLTRAAGGSIPALAGGGQVPGQSPNPTADNILMLGTAGEWMHSVRAVKYYGSDFMRAVGSLQLPRYAEGGEVGGGAGAPGEQTSLNLTINGRRLGSVTGARSTVRGIVNAMKELQIGTESER